jgi:hypothetical protein
MGILNTCFWENAFVKHLHQGNWRKLLPVPWIATDGSSKEK